jgi:hypothetical protein
MPANRILDSRKMWILSFLRYSGRNKVLMYKHIYKASNKETSKNGNHWLLLEYCPKHKLMFKIIIYCYFQELYNSL